MPRPFENFEVGHGYRLHEDMWPASPGYGNYISGIQPKGRYPDTEGVVVLAELGGGRYGNRWDGEELVYQGEDDRWAGEPRSADQSLEKGNNRVLTLQHRTRVPLYVFTKNSGETLWTYEGLAEVRNAELVQGGSRLVAEFGILPLGIPSEEELVRVEEEIGHSETEPPELTNRGTRLSVAARKVRSASFARRVKGNYHHSCAVCAASRHDAWGRPEVQAAHIFPCEKDGADDPRNGIALCSFHHWAYDGGLFAIDEQLRIRVTRPGSAIEDIHRLHDRQLEVLPTRIEENPHAVYIRARLQIPKFADLLRSMES